jgi:hypothetical protein
MKVAGPAFAKHSAGVKFAAALVREVLDHYALSKIRTTFGVELTDKTATQVLALSTVVTYDRSDFLRSVQPYKFNLGHVEQQLKAAAKKVTKKAPPVKRQRVTKGKVTV